MAQTKRRGRPKGSRAPGRFECPECKAEGIEKVFSFPTGLGAHRKFQHGVAGTSSAAVSWKKKRGRPSTRFECPECKAEGVKKVYNFAKALGAHRARAHGIAGTSASVMHKRNREGVNNNGSSNGTGGAPHDEVIAFWVGKITASFTSETHAIAERIGVSGEELTARCIAVLSDTSKALRTRYRLSHHL